jgi:type II secretory pathway pseudopilin PulG
MMRNLAFKSVRRALLRPKPRGMTLVEIVVAFTVAAFVLGFVIYLLWMSSRIVNIVFRQSIYQQNASLALDKIAELIRNARQRDFPSPPSSSVLYFKSRGTPSASTPFSEISLDGTAKRLYYYPDKDDRNTKETLAKNIESATFTITSDYVVRAIISFDYPRFTTILSGNPAIGMDGTFQTEIFPRPDTDTETAY